MKKNLLFGLFAAAGMLFATSCSNDELDVVQSGNEAQVTFSLGLEEAIGSRAISDGKTANKLVYAVYNSDGNALPVFEGAYQKTDNIGDITTTPHTVTIALAKGQTYKVVFWAQNKDCGAYGTSDLKNVTVSYDGFNNDENRDAFFKTVEFTVAGNKTIDVVLKRPFAQINVGVEKTDWNYAVASGIEIEKSKVVIDNAATSINLLDGTVRGEQTVTYALGAIPAEELMVDTDKDGNKEAYKWLSMSYILVNDTNPEDEDKDGTWGDDRATLNSLNFTFNPKSGNDIEFKEGLNNVPVQRNWRTNILGKILTGDIQFNITIDPVYEDDYNVDKEWNNGYFIDGNTITIYNEDGMQWFADNFADYNGYEGYTILLGNDIDLFKGHVNGEPITTAPIGDRAKDGNNNAIPFKGIFDGQGHAIKNIYQSGWALSYDWYNYGSIGLFTNLKDATIKNVVIDNMESFVEGGDVSFIAGSATGTCVFENIEIKNSTIATYNNGCGGIIGWSGAGEYTFKDITIGEDVVLGGLWGSFDSSIGGIVGQAETGATYKFENVEINCRIDAYNDCTASYDYYNYRMCGMIIGRCKETTTINGINYPDLSKYNITCTNVTVNYGDWMNYHYCEPTPGLNGGRGMRVESGYAYDGLPADFDHSQCVDNHMNCIPFDQLIGGDQLGVKGLREVDGVKVNYPYTYNVEEVKDKSGLLAAIGSGKNVKLIDDVNVGTTQLALDNVKIDLNGKTLTTSMAYGGISMKNGASIKNGIIEHTNTVAAIKAFNVGEIENITIKTTCSTANKTITAIAVQQGGYVGSIKNVTIEGVSQGIEVGYQATVDQIEEVTVNMNTNGTANGIGMVINGGKVGKAMKCRFNGDVYGITMHLKGVFDAGLELEECDVTGTTASIYAWDEKGISNTSGSLTLSYDAKTKLNGPFIWDFEDECLSVVTLNKPQ